MSPVLAFQVGLTSPAIIQSFMAAAGNQVASEGRPIEDPAQ